MTRPGWHSDARASHNLQGCGGAFPAVNPLSGARSPSPALALPSGLHSPALTRRSPARSVSLIECGPVHTPFPEKVRAAWAGCWTARTPRPATSSTATVATASGSYVRRVRTRRRVVEVSAEQDWVEAGPPPGSCSPAPASAPPPAAAGLPPGATRPAPGPALLHHRAIPATGAAAPDPSGSDHCCRRGTSQRSTTSVAEGSDGNAAEAEAGKLGASWSPRSSRPAIKA